MFSLGTSEEENKGSGVTMGWLLRRDGGPTGGRGPPTILEFLVINFRKVTGGPGWLRYASEQRDSRLTFFT